ncbi:hypothetical protein D3P08_19870 [Paenibacillus nanensis]|uniref:SPOR domain-containing protein n=1 Tax=Paenibacillus nanensis TaxID=393251 RepID=A0A3A1UZ30_9BACL|nr:hypothetical protein [Paenibacillus nanensis]RIX50540.1 hypothetical protein D3P08_19870 [Paenibacillus nanensis]
MNPNNRITYRFDRQGKQVADPEDKRPSAEHTRKQSPASKVIPLYQPLTTNALDEARPWDSAFQEDVGALEKLIRETEQPDADPEDREKDGFSSEQEETLHDMGASERTERYSSYEWQADDEDTDRRGILIEDEPHTAGVYRRRSKGPSWFNVFLSVAGALATGALFGYLILNLFTGDLIWPGSGTNNADSQGEQGETPISLDDIVSLPMGNAGDSGEQAGTGTAQEDQEAVAAAAVNIGGSYNYTFLQYGVFSGTKTRDEAMKQLADKGLPRSSTQSGEKYPVYAGLAADQTQAGALAQAMPGLLVYKKDIAIQPQKLLFNGSEETAKRFFEQTNGLVSSWSTLIVAQLEQPELSPIGKAASEAWKEKHKAWTETAAEMKKGVTDEKGISYLTKLTEAIESGAESMLAYEKRASKESLWKAQTSLMEAVLAQKGWFESMSAL